MSGQSEVRPVQGSCRHLRGLYKLQPSRKSPFPERRLVRYECELGYEIAADEELDKCSEPRVECWRVHQQTPAEENAE